MSPAAPEPETSPAPLEGLTVIMPGLNEEESVERAVRRVLEAVAPHVRALEVLVIDDGSTDRTGEIAEALARDDPRVRAIRNPRNLNYGRSLAIGIAAARQPWILHDGMDLPLAPEDLPRFLPLFEGADVVVARRPDRRAHSPWRRLTSWTNRALLCTLFRPRAADLNFVQFYRRSFAQSVSLVCTSPACVTPELVLRAEKTGRVVRELEVEFRRRSAGRAHFGKPKDIAWTLRDLLRLRLHTWLRGWHG